MFRLFFFSVISVQHLTRFLTRPILLLQGSSGLQGKGFKILAWVCTEWKRGCDSWNPAQSSGIQNIQKIYKSKILFFRGFQDKSYQIKFLFKFVSGWSGGDRWRLLHSRIKKWPWENIQNTGSAETTLASRYLQFWRKHFKYIDPPATHEDCNFKRKNNVPWRHMTIFQYISFWLCTLAVYFTILLSIAFWNSFNIEKLTKRFMFYCRNKAWLSHHISRVVHERSD